MNGRLGWGAVCCVLVGCSAGQVGGERQPCGPMGECFTGLTCLSNLCVRGAPGGGTATAGGAAAGGLAGGSAGGVSAAGGAAGGVAGGTAGGCVESACGVGEGCRNGSCQFALEGFDLTLPDAGVFGAPSVIPVRAAPRLSAGFVSANLPTSVRFELPSIDMGSLSRQGMEYRGSVNVPANVPSGTYRLTVSFMTGAQSVSDSQLMPIVSGPPVLSLAWPTAQRDLETAGWVVSDRPMAQVDARIGGVVAVPVPDSACAGVVCPSGKTCRCMRADMSLVSVPGVMANVPAVLTGRDLFGNEQTDGGASVTVTRVRWVVNPRAAPGTRGSAPVLDSSGTLYVTGSAAGTVNLTAIAPDGGIRGTIDTSDAVPVAALGRLNGQELVYSAWSTPTGAGIRGHFVSTLALAGTSSTTVGGTVQQPAVIAIDAGTTELVTTFGATAALPSRLVSTTLSATDTFEETAPTSAYSLGIPPSTNLPTNVVASEVRQSFFSISSFGGVRIAFNESIPPGPFRLGSPEPGVLLGMIDASAAGLVDPIVSGPRLYGAPYNTALSRWTTTTQVTNVGLLAMDESQGLVFGAGNRLVSLPAPWSTSALVTIQTSAAPIVMTPVLGEPRVSGTPGEGYAVTDALEVLVFRGTTASYSMQVPVTGRPLPPTLDCNRLRPASNTGVLYVATHEGPVVALVVDSPGLRRSARWPKYQRTAGNSGNSGDPVLNAGCP